MIITLRYKDGPVIDKEVPARSVRMYGVKLNGRRPVMITIPWEARPELVEFLRLILHPKSGRGGILRM